MKTLLFLTLLLIVTAAHAQQAGVDCVPVQGQGWSGCDPNYQPQPQSQAPQPPPQKWENYWGAIYTDVSKKVIGSSSNGSNQETAEQAALSDCLSKGGSHCKLQVSFRNGCAALITGNKIFNVNSAPTLDEAVQKGMTMCLQTGDSCHVYYSTCSLPSRTQ